MTHWWNIINKAQGAAVPVSMNNASDNQVKQEEQYIKTLESQLEPLKNKSSAGSISVEERNTLTRLQQRVNDQKQKIAEMKSKSQPTQREQMTTTLQQPSKPVPQQPTPQKNVGPTSPQGATNSDLSAQDLQALGLDPTKKPTKEAIDAAKAAKDRQKGAKKVSDESIRQFRLNQAKGKGNIKRQKVNVPEMIDLPPTSQMQAEADKDALINRLNEKRVASGSKYRVQRRKPFDAKKWQEQLRTRGQKAKLAEKEAQKQKRTASRTAMKDKTLRRIARKKDKALRREEKARRKQSKARTKQSKDDKASGLTDAGRRFLDNQQTVADAGPRKTNVTTFGVAPKS